MLYIPFHYYTNTGGPKSFMENLKLYFDTKNFPYTINVQKASHIFFPISYELSTLKKIKSNKGKIIQRLDGIFYPSKHGDKYIDLNAETKEIYLNFADHIIFQSQYSKNQCFELFGEKKQTDYSFIYNGANKNVFFADTTINKPKEFHLITTGKYRNIDMLEPIIQALSILKNNYHFKLHIVGPIVNYDLERFINHDYVIYHGEKSSTEIAELLRKSNIFIYSHLNPPCPNSVVEAISCGLPVVGFDSGAMSELCWFAKELLVPVSNEIFQKYEDFDCSMLSEKIALTIDNYKFYKELALQNVHLYDANDMGRAYMEEFNKITNTKYQMPIVQFIKNKIISWKNQ